MKEKIYRVAVTSDVSDDSITETLLVKALTRAGAVRIVRARVRVSAELASQYDLIDMLKNGTEILDGAA